MQINFEFGQVVSFADMPANSIALDGACQSPQVDPANRRFSFDHHSGCLRFATLATCQQVALAIRMGLVTDCETLVFVNDLDADTSLAVWLLKNPGRIDEPRVVEILERIALTDAHGPLFPPHWLHSQLQPRWGSKDPQAVEMLDGFLAKIDQYADGTLEAPAKPAREPSKGFGWSPKTGWIEIDAADGFASAYGQGCLVAVLYMPAAEETSTYTVGKRSDFVGYPVGPSHADRNADPGSYRKDTLLGALGLAELEANPQQSHKDNWGGASTVGGSPRVTIERDGAKIQLASKLTPSQVLEICKRFG
jgi:hypothetical protein